MPCPARAPDRRRARALGLAVALAATACVAETSSYQLYAERASALGDSALTTVSAYLSLDSTSAVRYDPDAARRLERLASGFAGTLRPDTVAIFHRQMLDGLDSLVVAMRVLGDRQTGCERERTIDCVDDRDFGHILGSLRAGTRLYLDARRQMRTTLRSLGASFPDPPAVSVAALGSPARAASPP